MSSTPHTKTAENKRRLSRHNSSSRLQSSNQGAGSVVSTVKLSSKDANHQRREAADKEMRQLRPPWPQLFLYTRRCMEACGILLGLGNPRLGNTNRRATLSRWRRGLWATGEEAVTET